MVRNQIESVTNPIHLHQFAKEHSFYEAEHPHELTSLNQYHLYSNLSPSSVDTFCPLRILPDG